MHGGKVDFGLPGRALDAQAQAWRRANAATRVFLVLMSRPGEWFDSWTLTQEARSTAVGTRVAEIREQCPAWLRVEHKQERDAAGNVRHFYRLVRVIPETNPLLNRPFGHEATVAAMFDERRAG